MAAHTTTTPVRPSLPPTTSTLAEDVKAALTPVPTATQAPAGGPFELGEFEQFRSDDAAAARTIGKILSTLFLYTLIVMSLVVWWTLKTVLQ